MLKKNIYIISFVFLFMVVCQAQSIYMHEAQEETLEQEHEEGFITSIVGLLLIFGIIYVFGNIWYSHKDNQKQKEESKQKKIVSEFIAKESLVNNKISKYQHKKAWQKGYKKATYDRLNNMPRELVGKTIDDLIAEYRHTCELGHIVQADKIMEEIGYFQCLNTNNSC